MTSKKLLSALMALVFALSLFTALPVSAANGTVTVTVGGATIASGGTIPAKSNVVITLPYALTSEQIATNVVLSESTKATTVTWNAREFDGYTLDGDQLTIPFALGDLAMNGSYKFTFTDPAAAGAAVEFAFNTSASDSYVMYDNFSRYPAGAIAQDAVTHYPFFTRYAGFDDNGNKYPAEIKTDANGTKFLRLNNSTRNNSENVVSYRTAFSAPVTATYFNGVTEVEFSMLHETTSMFEIGGIIFKIVDDNNIDVYMRHKNPAWNGSFGYDPTNWTKLGTATYATKAETDGKHVLKFVATHQTNANDKRTLKKLWLDNVEIGAEVIGDAGLLFGSGGHSVLHQGVLLYNTGSFKNASSVTFDIMNAGSGCPVNPYMDVYSIKYYEYITPPVTVVTAPTAATIAPAGGTITYGFSKAIDSATISNSTVVLEKEANGAWSTVNVAQYASLDANDATKLNITIPKGVLVPSTNYKLSLKAGLTAADGGALTEPAPYLFATEALPVATITPSVASGSTISPVGTLSFAFDYAINEASLANGFVFEEKDKRATAGQSVTVGSNTGTVPQWHKRLCDYSLSDDGKTITITFTEGDIAANSTYRVRLTDAITLTDATMGSERIYEYTTSQYGKYLINDNFSRFVKKLYSSGTTESAKPWESGMMPYSKSYGGTSAWAWNLYAVEADKGDALRMQMRTTGAGYGYLSYENTYAPEVVNTLAHRGTYEFNFDIIGVANAVFEVGEFAFAPLKDDATKYGLFVRIAGASTGTVDYNQWIKVKDIPSYATLTNYTLKYEISTSGSYAGYRTLHKAWLNGEEITLPAGGINITLNREASYMDNVFKVDGMKKGSGFGRLLAIGVPTEASAEAELTRIDLYSFKYSASGLNTTVADGATTGAKDITFVNDGADTSVLAVLAVYDGDTLVGVDGMATPVSVAAGATVTVNRAVANAVAGNTYKVMLINTKDALQPVTYAKSGTIN